VTESMVVDDAGHLVVGLTTTRGVFGQNYVDFGNGQLNGGDPAGFLVAFDAATGDTLWSKVAGPSIPSSAAVALDAGDFVFAGANVGSVDFGAGAVSNNGVWVARFDAGGGALSTSSVGSDAWASTALTWTHLPLLAVDGLHHAVVAGGFWDPIQFGGAGFTTHGTEDAYVAAVVP
jgi:PQQ enzyme repeat